MPVEKIHELRLLPPLSIARFGSSTEPMHNYSLEDGEDVGGFRALVPQPTFLVDVQTGRIEREATPAKMRFLDDDGRVKPVAPFVELWARFEEGGELEPLTLRHLSDLELKPSDVSWSVRAANSKVFRRTGDVGDRVSAHVGPITDHARWPIVGAAPYFKPGKTIPFGFIQYIVPTEEFPEIRFRFTPAAGLVYGPRDDDSLVHADVYAGYTSTPSPPGGYPGRWDRYWIGDREMPPVTAPGDIFQGQPVGDTKLSDGYFDDTCDGLVEVSLDVGGVSLRASSRFISAVPDFAPDSQMVRSIHDDLEQIVLGPEVDDDVDREELKSDVVDILRRSIETVRLMNMEVHNGDPGAVADVDSFRNNMAGQQAGYGRHFAPFFEPAPEFGPTLEAHQRLLASAIDADPDTAFSIAAFFMRSPDSTATLSARERRKMPAMMRGSDGLELALTRRQLDKLQHASRSAPGPEGAEPLSAEALGDVPAESPAAAAAPSAVVDGETPAASDLRSLHNVVWRDPERRS